ncbi:hypothetical protein JG687_00018020 [Phytophthora cactorum]|uniref:Uncharacterized protein n=1 Tax=Phytophthora cactorum TaxID=29920 RepID=A0A8T1TMR1_9STRA|nr:hypothetical protein JG687_00018020 [Phytophthora cactorum]
MTYYECLRNKLLFKSSDTYRWFEVYSQTYFKGDKKVREMLDHAEHVNFLEELVNFTAKNKLLNPNAKSSTRALCALHLFLSAIKHPIKPEEFRQKFKCNYETIRTIVLDLFHANDQLIPIFDQHSVPRSAARTGLNAYSERSKKVVRMRRAKHGRIEIGSA